MKDAGYATGVVGKWHLGLGDGLKVNGSTNAELGNDRQPQRYILADDPGETKNLAERMPGKVREMRAKPAANRDRSEAEGETRREGKGETDSGDSPGSFSRSPPLRVSPSSFKNRS